MRGSGWRMTNFGQRIWCKIGMTLQKGRHLIFAFGTSQRTNRVKQNATDAQVARNVVENLFLKCRKCVDIGAGARQFDFRMTAKDAET